MISPDETDAKEKTKWAINAYNNGWFDQAIEYFDISKKLYPFDFIVYQFLGNIYLFERKNPKDALENYKLALKYIEPYDKYYASLASLHIGLSHYEIGNYQDAYIAASNAIQMNPKFSEAYYRRAQYCSKLGKYNEALNNLEKAIKADRGYCLKALAEKDFEPMSDKLGDFVEDLTKEEQVKADKEIMKSKELIKKFEYIDVPRDAREKLEEGISFRNAQTYLNCRDAVYKACASQKALVDSLSTLLSSEVSDLEASKNILKKQFNRLDSSVASSQKIFLYVLCYTLAVSMLAGLTGDLMGKLIAFISQIVLLGFLFRYLLYMYKKIICTNNLKSLENNKLEKNNIIAAVKSEKNKLNIDKLAESLNYVDYEKYLRRTYG